MAPMDLPTRFFHVRVACSAYLTDMSAHPCKPKSSAWRYLSAGNGAFVWLHCC